MLPLYICFFLKLSMKKKPGAKVMFLPLFLVSRLQKFGRKEKYMVAFVVFLGILSITASMIRFAVCWKAAQGFQTTQISAGTTISILICLEIWTAYVAACLPAFRSFLHKSAENKGSKPSSSGGGSSDFAKLIFHRSNKNSERTRQSDRREQPGSPSGSSAELHTYVQQE